MRTQVPIMIELLSLLVQKASSRAMILDIGCGAGAYTYEYTIKNPNSDIIALDIKRNKINFVNKLLPANGSGIVANCLQLPFKGNVFDIIICTEVVEHLEKDNQAIKEISRALKQGGGLILSVPNINAKFQCNLEREVKMGHHMRKGYDVYSLQNLLGKYDLRIITKVYHMFFFSQLAMYISHRFWLPFMPLMSYLDILTNKFIKNDLQKSYDIIIVAKK
jgi:ubiquinone/menaquinone biosynthesis C-methylase UbiE